MDNFNHGNKPQEKNSSFETNHKNMKISDFFGNFVHELITYSHKIFGYTHEKVRYSDDFEKTADEKYQLINSEVSNLKEHKSESKKQMQEYIKKAKQLNLLEVQVKLAQIKQNKKKFLKFWKRHD